MYVIKLMMLLIVNKNGATIVALAGCSDSTGSRQIYRYSNGVLSKSILFISSSCRCRVASVSGRIRIYMQYTLFSPRVTQYWDGITHGHFYNMSTEGHNLTDTMQCLLLHLHHYNHSGVVTRVCGFCPILFIR